MSATAFIAHSLFVSMAGNVPRNEANVAELEEGPQRHGERNRILPPFEGQT